jgi:hypothetical protein
MISGVESGRPGHIWRVIAGHQAPETVDRLLRLLPDWFGIESSIIEYVAKAHELPTYLAWPAGGSVAEVTESRPVGVMLAARHFPESAEIYLMAVELLSTDAASAGPIEALEADLVADGVELLQVKTLGPSHADVGYGAMLETCGSAGKGEPLPAPARIVDRHAARAALPQHGQGLRRRAADHDVLGLHDHAAHARQVLGDGVPELGNAAMIGVGQPGVGQLTQRPQQHRLLAGARERVEIGYPRPQVVAEVLGQADLPSARRVRGCRQQGDPGG